jgi:hypothetical protein
MPILMETQIHVSQLPQWPVCRIPKQANKKKGHFLTRFSIVHTSYSFIGRWRAAITFPTSPTTVPIKTVPQELLLMQQHPAKTTRPHPLRQVGSQAFHGGFLQWRILLSQPLWPSLINNTGSSCCTKKTTNPGL